MRGVERVKFVVREACGPGVRAVHMRAAAGVERDADGVPGRHADHHLREQEERKHEAEAEAAHGAYEESSMYGPNEALVKRDHALPLEIAGPHTMDPCSPATSTSAEGIFES